LFIFTKKDKIYSYLANVAIEETPYKNSVLNILNYTKPSLSNLSSIACEDLIAHEGLLDQ